MTGCKGYGLRGSDARTEIEHTKEADTPGEIPGRSGLQADRRTGNKLSLIHISKCGGGQKKIYKFL